MKATETWHRPRHNLKVITLSIKTWENKTGKVAGERERSRRGGGGQPLEQRSDPLQEKKWRKYQKGVGEERGTPKSRENIGETALRILPLWGPSSDSTKRRRTQGQEKGGRERSASRFKKKRTLWLWRRREIVRLSGSVLTGKKGRA